MEFSEKLALAIKYIEEFELNNRIVITDSDNKMLYCTDNYAKMFLSDPHSMLSLTRLKNFQDEYFKNIAKKSTAILKALSNPSNPHDYLTVIGIFKNYQQNMQKTCFFWQARKLSDSLVKHTIDEFNLSQVSHVLYLVNCLKYPKFATNIPKQFSNIDLHLNYRDHEILLLLTFGQSYKEISYILSNAYAKEISATAIKTYIHNTLLVKIDCSCIEEAIFQYLISTPLKIPLHLLNILEGFLTVDIFPKI